jgi:hypothetical protein
VKRLRREIARGRRGYRNAKAGVGSNNKRRVRSEKSQIKKNVKK